MYQRILVPHENTRTDRADLIAMATHGHRMFHDLIRGSIASERRHRTHVPVLMVREAMPRSAP